MANEESIKREEEALRSLMDLKKDYAQVLEKESKQVLVYLRAKKQLAAAEKIGAENVAQLRETVLEYRGAMDESEEEILEMTEAIEKQSESIKAQREQLAKTEKRLASFRAGLDKLTNSNISSITSMKGFFDNIINVTFALESQSIGLARTTGYTKDFADNLTGLTKRNAVLGISLEESAKIISGLSTGMARFNAVGDAQQSVLEDISARFMRLGVDSKEFGSALDTINYAFGLTGQAAAEAGKSLEGLASEIGRPLDSVVQDLNDIGPTLGRFGQQGIQVFRKLATQARELGLTTKQAFDVSELFDTFEGAANIAGRLNAQLGLQLNSVELMKASSEDRLDILRSEFQLQGKSFESMGRRQRQMIASILGKDEETAARLLGDKMDISRFQKEKAEEKTITDMVTMQEQMTNLMQQIALPLSEHLLTIAEFVKKNYEVISKWVPRIAVAVIAMKALSGAGNLIQNLGGGGGRAGIGRLLTSGGGLLSKGAGAAAGMGGFLSKGLGKMAAKRIPIIGGLLGAGMNIASGEGIGRSIFGGLGAAGGTLLGALGGGGIASIPLAMAGGYGGEKLGTGLYDKIFGAPTGPSTTNAEMNTTMRQNRQAARGGTTMPNITMPVELKVDGKVWATSTVKVMNDQLALTKSN
tara:strand:- start:5935 stop:7866 length:1932 start_codon:yes stop_codon:yes gene_type:complete